MRRKTGEFGKREVEEDRKREVRKREVWEERRRK